MRLIYTAISAGVAIALLWYEITANSSGVCIGIIKTANGEEIILIKTGSLLQNIVEQKIDACFPGATHDSTG